MFDIISASAILGDFRIMRGVIIKAVTNKNEQVSKTK